MNGYDLAYGLGLALATPYWALVPDTRRKVLKALRERMGREQPRTGNGPAVMIHAVSLGEMNATRALVRALGEARPEIHFIVSTTTETGYARGRELYGADPRATLIHYPLDFSAAIRRVLDRQKPLIVVLMELEVWPNFVSQCTRRGIPVALVNGRLTASSFRSYRRVKPLVRQMFSQLAIVCAQDETYARRFAELGAPPENIRVTGTMKFDTAQVASRIEGADELAAALGLSPGTEPIWVCGSTGPGEEEHVLHAYRVLLKSFPTLRLVIVPRKPERFDEVAALITREGFGLIRRSKPDVRSASFPAPVILGDTMGELRKFYSLADVVFVGRTLVDLGPRQHGSDMIEPAALAKPVTVGPFTGNFAEVMARFREANAMREIASPGELAPAIERFLNHADEGERTAQRAQEVVRKEQGATARHAEIILGLLRGKTIAGQAHSESKGAG